MCYFYSFLCSLKTQVVPDESPSEVFLVKIRDMIPLTDDEIEKISKLSENDRMKIIYTYNSVVDSLQVLYR